MTPMGIIIGSVLSEIDSNRTALWFEAVFDALATGTFVYIAVLDIINEVFEAPQKRWPKFGILILGFVLMAGIAIWT
jgi:zinc transporter 1/2/3